MKPSRLVLIAGVLGALYSPAAFAASTFNTVDMIWENGADTDTDTDTTSGSELKWPTSTFYRTGSDMDVIQEMVVTDSMMKMTRATFTQMVVDHLYTRAQIERCYWDITSPLPPTFTLLYTDVAASEPYGKELCLAMRDGLAQGYKDGSFRPNQLITFAEASKILANAYSLAPYAEVNRPADAAWYAPYAFALTQQHAVPSTVTTFYHTMTAGETAEILDRLSNNITTKTGMTFERLELNSKPVVKKPVSQKSTTTTVSAVKKNTTPQTGGQTSSMPSSMPMSAGTSSTQPWYKLF